MASSVHPRTEVTFWKFLYNHHCGRMEIKIIMRNSPYRTTKNSKGGRVLGDHDWNSYCLNILWWSNGSGDSISSFCNICSLSERSDSGNIWFRAWDRGNQGWSKAIPGGTLGCDDRTSARIVRLNNESTLPTASTHDSNWTVSWQNFIVPPLEPPALRYGLNRLNAFETTRETGSSTR